MNKTHFMGLLLATLLLGAQPLLAQTCNSSVRATAPDSRYTDNLNGTVTDDQTGLMWQKCSLGLSGSDCLTGGLSLSYNWQSALAAANSNTDYGYSDWRLPNLKELASLVEDSCFFPAINMTAFPNTDSNMYWAASPTASLDVYDPSNPNSYDAFFAGVVNFSVGAAGNFDKTFEFLSVRLVRGGQ